MPNNKVLLKEIAIELGYSVVMISRALNNTGRVSELKRKRILNCAIERGFFASRFFSTSFIDRISLFVPYGIMNKGKDPFLTMFHLDIIDNIRTEAKKARIKLYVNCDKNGKITQKTVTNILRIQKPDAILGVGIDYDYLKLISLSEDIPVLLINSSISSNNVNTISPNNTFIGYQCTSYLVNKGYENIIHVSDFSRDTIRNRYKGFREAMLISNLSFSQDDNLLNVSNVKRDEIFKKVLKFLDKYEFKKRTAFFASSDFIAMQTMKALQNSGYRVGEDVGVMGIDNDPFASKIVPKLTTYELPKKQLASRALQILAYNNLMGLKDNFKLELYGKIIERDSV